MASSALALLSGMFWAAAAPADAGTPEACRPCARGCALVMTTGRDGGGMELAAVVDLNMRGWKPQSSHGIEILGWSSTPLAPGRCVVSYTYRDGTPVVIQWQVDLGTARVTPLSPLAERMQRMTLLLSHSDVNSKARKP